MNKEKAYSLFFEKGLYRIMILVVMCVLLTCISDSFLSLSNIMNIFRQASILLILAVGATGTILAKGIDLSLAGVMSLSGCVCGYVLNAGYPVPVAILAALSVGIGFGFVNGFLVGVVKIPAFVSTYGVKYIANGLALMLMGSNIFFGFPESFLSPKGRRPFPCFTRARTWASSAFSTSPRMRMRASGIMSSGRRWERKKYACSAVATGFLWKTGVSWPEKSCR